MNNVLIPDSIKKFIKSHHVLTLATSGEEGLWCCNCFYAWLDDESCFVFTSDTGTRHVKNIEKNAAVSGTIVLETKIVGKIQGLQFSGKIIEPDEKLNSKVRIRFLKRFPYAIIKDTRMWCLYPDYLKYTDNRLGFGKKIHWPQDLSK